VLPNNKNATKKLFLDSRLFWPFFNQKTAKRKEKKMPKSKPFDEIFEICYLDASQQRKCYKKLLLDFGLFWPFLNQKTAKKNKNCQNPNCLMKFSEIWYVDASQQNKMLQKNFFWISTFLIVF